MSETKTCLVEPVVWYMYIYVNISYIKAQWRAQTF